MRINKAFIPLETKEQSVKRKMFLSGFTLLEIMITVAIIGILVALAVPSYWGVLERSRQREAVVNLGLLRGAQERYALEKGGVYTNTFNDLDAEDPSTNARFFTYTVGTVGTAVATATRRITSGAVNPGYCAYTINISNISNLTLAPQASPCRRPPDP